MQSYIFFANYVLFLPENVYLRSQMKITKNKFLLGFGIVVLILALIKAIFPEVSTPRNEQALVAESPQPDEDVSHAVATPSPVVKKPFKKHRIRGVQNYKATFPDSQAVQIVAAERWGVRPVKNREDAEKRRRNWSLSVLIPIIMLIRYIVRFLIWCLVPQYCWRISEKRSTIVCM